MDRALGRRAPLELESDSNSRWEGGWGLCGGRRPGPGVRENLEKP